MGPGVFPSGECAGYAVTFEESVDDLFPAAFTPQNIGYVPKPLGLLAH